MRAIGWTVDGIFDLLNDDPLKDWVLNESGEGEEPQQCPADKPKGKNTVPGYNGPPGGYVEGPRRGREYGSDGKPVRDYDKPHQGHETPHVHEWPGGVREHPGRDYSPWPPK